MKKIAYLILFLIVIAGGFLRMYNLSNSPPSLNWDEAAWGYNAYTISETGKDEYGKLFPIFTRSFDEYKSTLPLYLMIPSIRIFGLNETAVRLPSALLGTFATVLIFLLSKELFRNNAIALVSALVFAIEPWAVHTSRVYYDANEALFFLLLGLLLFLYSKRKQTLLGFSSLAFVISMYTYNANKVLVPLFLLGLIFISRKTLRKYSRKVLFASSAILAVSVFLFLFLALKGEALARVDSTSIFIFWPITPPLSSLIEQHSLPKLFEFFLHSPIFYFSWEVLGRYFAYFSPPNLFLREPQEPATILAGNSIFHSFEFIPWLVGLLFLLVNFKKYKEITLLIVLSPMPAMFTWNWFQPGRALSLFAVFSILIGVGLVEIISYISLKAKKTIKPQIAKGICYSVLIMYAVISAVYIFDSVNVYLPLRDSGNWQPGFRETVPVVMMHEQNFSQVLIETGHGQPHIFYLFYGQYSPQRYLSELDLVRIGTPRKSFDFGKFVFRKIYWPEDRNLKNTMFVGSEESLPQEDIDSQPGAKVLEIVKNSRGDIQAKIVSTAK